MAQVYPLDEETILDFVKQAQENQVNSLTLESQLLQIKHTFPHAVNLIEWLTSNYNNFVDVSEPRAWDRHEFVYYLGLAKEELHISAAILLPMINKHTLYEITHTQLEELFYVLKILRIDLQYPFDKQACHRIQHITKTNQAHYVRYFHEIDADNLLLRCYLNQQMGNSNKIQMGAKQYSIFPEPKEATMLTFMDFNDEILEQLPIHMLMVICTNKELICPTTKDQAESILVQKLQRMDKLYVIDIPHEDALNAYIVQHPAPQENFLDILVDAKAQVNSPSFTQKVDRLVKEIADDLVCIHFMLVWNNSFSKNNNQLSQHNMKKMEEFLSKMNTRQRCLCKQVFTSIVHMQTDAPTYHPNLISIAQRMLDKIPESCYTFVTNHQFISCSHETFHPYSLSKWMDIYCEWFTKFFPGNECTYPNVEKYIYRSGKIYPKKGFCGGCYKAYKQLQNTRANASRNDDIPVRFAYFVLKGQLYFYRIRFSDVCDDPVTAMHVTQINIQRTTREKSLEEIIMAISKEQRTFSHFMARR